MNHPPVGGQEALSSSDLEFAAVELLRRLEAMGESVVALHDQTVRLVALADAPIILGDVPVSGSWTPPPGSHPDGAEAPAMAVATLVSAGAVAVSAPTVAGFEWAPDDPAEAAFDAFFSADVEPEPSQEWLLAD